MDLHNSFIKKNASEIFETNAFDDNIQQVHNVVTPTVEIKPNINIVRSSSATGTLYTTPSTYDFYLTNIHMTVWNDTSLPQAGSAVISFTPRESPQQSFQIYTEIAGNGPGPSQDILFPMRGVLLEKNSAITITVLNSQGKVLIAGYTGSDRS